MASTRLRLSWARLAPPGALIPRAAQARAKLPAPRPASAWSMRAGVGVEVALHDDLLDQVAVDR